jgi:hypothetical protein
MGKAQRAHQGLTLTTLTNAQIDQYPIRFDHINEVKRNNQVKKYLHLTGNRTSDSRALGTWSSRDSL